MGMRETFQIIIDVVSESGQKSLKDLRREVGDTDGTFGKLKAAGGGAMDYVKDHAAAFAVGAATAIGVFAIKAVAAFEDTAKAAIDMSKTTGLSIEDASRWIGVGEDYRIGAETLTGAIGKITKSLDDVKWAKFGIETKTAAGDARDANDVLIDTLSKLSAMPNKTAQAEEGFKLFGKGFGAIAPLLGHTREEYVKMLGAVEKGQVITEAEARKAEKMRLAEDQLSDALKEVGLAAGGLVADLAPLIVVVAKLLSGISSLGDLGSSMDDLAKQGKAAIDTLKAAAEEERETLLKLRDANEHHGLAALDAKDATHKQSLEMQEFNDVLGASKLKMDNLTAAWDIWKGDISDKQAVLDIHAAFDDFKTSVDETGASSDETKGKMLNLDLKLGEYAQHLGGLPPEVITLVQASIDNGTFKTAEDAINALDLAAQNLRNTLIDGHREWESSSFVAGGPQAVGSREYSPTYNITINGTNMTDQQVVNALHRYDRINGGH